MLHKRIVCTVAKCNNGLLPVSTAWERANGPFSPLPEFDMVEWKQSVGSSIAGGHKEKITKQHLRDVFNNGRVFYMLGDAVRKLIGISGAKDKACHAALARNGRFAHLLKFEGKEIGLWCAEDEDGA